MSLEQLEKLRQLVWQRGVKRHRGSGFRMTEAQSLGMQEMPVQLTNARSQLYVLQIVFATGAIYVITHHRVF